MARCVVRRCSIDAYEAVVRWCRALALYRMTFAVEFSSPFRPSLLLGFSSPVRLCLPCSVLAFLLASIRFVLVEIVVLLSLVLLDLVSLAAAALMSMWMRLKKTRRPIR